MRTKKEIQDESNDASGRASVEVIRQKLALEILLDIREQNAAILALLQDVITNRQQFSVRKF